jgi:hypothetical protein
MIDRWRRERDSRHESERQSDKGLVLAQRKNSGAAQRSTTYRVGHQPFRAIHLLELRILRALANHPHPTAVQGRTHQGKEPSSPSRLTARRPHRLDALADLYRSARKRREPYQRVRCPLEQHEGEGVEVSAVDPVTSMRAIDNPGLAGMAT